MPTPKIVKPEEASEIIREMDGNEARDRLMFLCGAFAVIKELVGGAMAWKTFTSALGKPADHIASAK